MTQVNPPYFLSKLRPHNTPFDNYYNQLENIIFGLYVRSGGETDIVEVTNNNESDVLTNARIYRNEKLCEELLQLVHEPNAIQAQILHLLNKVQDLEHQVVDYSAMVARATKAEQQIKDLEARLDDSTLAARLSRAEQQIKELREL